MHTRLRVQFSSCWGVRFTAEQTFGASRDIRSIHAMRLCGTSHRSSRMSRTRLRLQQSRRVSPTVAVQEHGRSFVRSVMNVIAAVHQEQQHGALCAPAWGDGARYPAGFHERRDRRTFVLLPQPVPVLTRAAAFDCASGRRPRIELPNNSEIGLA